MSEISYPGRWARTNRWKKNGKNFPDEAGNQEAWEAKVDWGRGIICASCPVWGVTIVYT